MPLFPLDISGFQIAEMVAVENFSTGFFPEFIFLREGDPLKNPENFFRNFPYVFAGKN
jgi:hypothetical protein